MNAPTNSMISDDDLQELFATAAGSFPVPPRGGALVRGQLQDLRDARPARSKRRGLFAVAAVAVVGLAFAVAPHVGGSGGAPSTAATAELAPAASPAAARSYSDLASTDSSGVAAGPDSLNSAGVRSPSAATPVPPARSLSGSGGTRAGVSGVTPAAAAGTDAPRIVETGTFTLQAPKGKVEATLNTLRVRVVGLRGYVSTSSTQDVGTDPTGTVTYRVPVANYGAAVTAVKALGVTVLTEAESGRDITAQYADVGAQIASLTAARNRYLTILGAAKTVGEILAVQQRVDNVQGQIDQLTGQQKVLADQSSLATITVTVAEKVPSTVPVKPQKQNGLSKAFHDAGHGFVTGVEALVRRSGRALLLLIVLAIVAVIARPTYRIARRRLV